MPALLKARLASVSVYVCAETVPNTYEYNGYNKKTYNNTFHDNTPFVSL
jgi:hypothetical protein